jgi:hypothetical protein
MPGIDADAGTMGSGELWTSVAVYSLLSAALYS